MHIKNSKPQLIYKFAYTLFVEQCDSQNREFAVLAQSIKFIPAAQYDWQNRESAAKQKNYCAQPFI